MTAADSASTILPRRTPGYNTSQATGVNARQVTGVDTGNWWAVVGHAVGPESVYWTRRAETSDTPAVTLSVTDPDNSIVGGNVRSVVVHSTPVLIVVIATPHNCYGHQTKALSGVRNGPSNT